MGDGGTSDGGTSDREGVGGSSLVGVWCGVVWYVGVCVRLCIFFGACWDERK